MCLYVQTAGDNFVCPSRTTWRVDMDDRGLHMKPPFVLYGQ
jgi:hypothetical protein